MGAQHQIGSGQLTVTINATGAELSSIAHTNGLEYLWQADKEVWPRHAPVLFPIVGRLKQNQFIFEDKPYSLGQHGFARDQEFNLLEKTAASCSFELRATPETKKNYPFDFVLRIAYRVEQNKLTCFYTVINPSQTTLFFSIGAHPGFNCPLEADERFEDYCLAFEPGNFLYTELADGLRTGLKQELPLEGNKLFLTGHLFDKDALVFEQSQVSSVCLRSPRHSILLGCAGWPYFGIWSKKNSTRFVCLEPWFGVADHVNSTGRLEKKEGIIALAAGQEFSCSFALTLD